MNSGAEKIVVTGAGGFIGHHLARFLKKKGYWVRGVDVKKPEYSSVEEFDEFLLLDLRRQESCDEAFKGVQAVYALAANMGGMGFIGFNGAEILHDNTLLNINTAEAAKREGVRKVFFSSSACVYPEEKQLHTTAFPLQESDAYPAHPDTEYGWEKLFSERVYQAYAVEGAFQARIARYHNIFGQEGTYDGGREKVPAALSRKIVLAKQEDTIEVWGDGEQTRSFCYVDDCVEGTWRLMESDVTQPINIGSDRFVAINEMVDIIAKIAGKRIEKTYLLDKPQGVRGRNSDNTLCRKVLGWEPKVSLEDGLEKTYQWLKGEIQKKS